ncbi:hypothetical protein PY32053_00892 [Paracoccus yeei]|uniref:Uncharacterized protein n=1 Tax=Paracoccus yeei TaxID=147645 RepID=A0A386UJB6_9RHOB|nr:hypothetical protein PY32053_00892 [Paracoccus yeei]
MKFKGARLHGIGRTADEGVDTMCPLAGHRENHHLAWI